MKTALAPVIPADPQFNTLPDLPTRIAQRAWELWMADPRREDSEAEIWLEAERQVCGVGLPAGSHDRDAA